MRYLNAVQLRVFCRPKEEDEEGIKKALLDLVPFDLEAEKVRLKKERARGFEEKPITIFTVELTRQRHTNLFLKQLLNRLTNEQKQFLLSQAESRLDDDLCFFIRLDKDKWLDERETRITDSGRCFHVRLNLAVFPAKREKARELIEKLLTQGVK